MNNDDIIMLGKIKEEGKKMGDPLLQVCFPKNFPKELMSTISKYSEEDKINLVLLVDDLNDLYLGIFQRYIYDQKKLIESLQKLRIFVFDSEVKGGNYISRFKHLVKGFFFFISCYLYYLSISLRSKGELILINCKLISKPPQISKKKP